MISKKVVREFIQCKINIDVDGEDHTDKLIEVLNKYDDLLPAARGVYSKYEKNIYFYNLIKKMDLYRSLRFKLQKEYKLKNVSNAWLKYYEMAVHFKLDKMKLNCFFNAEFPGSGILALKEFSKNRTVFDWVASSLMSSKYNTALEDSYGLFRNNRDKWLPDENNDGDMTNLDNIYYTAEKIKKRNFMVNCYLHDAGIGVETFFDTPKKGFKLQEEINTKLHLGCALCGFLTLQKGGFFLAKQYTFFRPLNASLIVIYARLFDEFYICKPKTSRPENSEIYLIGVGFRGLPKDVEELLVGVMKRFDASPKNLENNNFDAITKITEQNYLDLKDSMKIFDQQYEFLQERNEFLKLYSSTDKYTIDKVMRSLEKLSVSVTAGWIKNIFEFKEKQTIK